MKARPSATATACPIPTDLRSKALYIVRDRNGTFDPVLTAKQQHGFADGGRNVISTLRKGRHPALATRTASSVWLSGMNNRRTSLSGADARYEHHC